MNVEWVQPFCMALAHATEAVQSEDNLVFKIGCKMFAIAALEPAGVWFSFKCTADDFAQLVEPKWYRSGSLFGSGELGWTQRQRCCHKTMPGRSE